MSVYQELLSKHSAEVKVTLLVQPIQDAVCRHDDMKYMRACLTHVQTCLRTDFFMANGTVARVRNTSETASACVLYMMYEKKDRAFSVPAMGFEEDLVQEHRAGGMRGVGSKL